MKVGTDGVLVGAWAPLTTARHILDIGTGSGLIALMAAQRNESATIDAVEMETTAATQAAENVAASPWQNRITVYPLSIQNFLAARESRPVPAETRKDISTLSATAAEKYDAIVSNPPFFDETTPSPDHKRTAARHTVSLSFEELMRCAAALLVAGGTFTLIHPATATAAVQEAAALHRLTCVGLCAVRTTPRKEAKRMLATYQKSPARMAFRRETLTIHTDDGGYDEAYVALTREFYIGF